MSIKIRSEIIITINRLFIVIIFKIAIIFLCKKMSNKVSLSEITLNILIILSIYFQILSEK